MTVEQLLNQIERRLTNNVTRNAAVNRYELRELLNETLAELTTVRSDPNVSITSTNPLSRTCFFIL